MSVSSAAYIGARRLKAPRRARSEGGVASGDSLCSFRRACWAAMCLPILLLVELQLCTSARFNSEAAVAKWR